MGLTILYRERSEHARAVTEFVEMLKRRYPAKQVKLIEIDTKEGADEARLHGVTQYPAFIVTSYEGRVIQQWEGEHLPLIDEVGGMIVDSTLEPESSSV